MEEGNGYLTMDQLTTLTRADSAARKALRIAIETAEVANAVRPDLGWFGLANNLYGNGDTAENQAIVGMFGWNLPYYYSAPIRTLCAQASSACKALGDFRDGTKALRSLAVSLRSNSVRINKKLWVALANMPAASAPNPHKGGIPKWSPEPSYYIGGLVEHVGIVYVSLQNYNLDKNPATQPLWWKRAATVVPIVVSPGGTGTTTIEQKRTVKEATAALMALIVSLEATAKTLGDTAGTPILYELWQSLGDCASIARYEAWARLSDPRQATG